ncbi:MAG: methylmalonyl Co-A mutase-associated GTPase MeaB [Anaerolineales bacterium]
MTNLINDLRNGDRLALSRLLSQVENDTTEGREALNEIFIDTGSAHLIGVTGAPGVGKSSLVNQLVLHIRKNTEKKIAIIAVDPTSPFSGGAVLGDRVRMRDLSGDDHIFIRSMASRGNLGGLAHGTAALTQVFDAAGFDLVFIETVGAGQAEVDIARLAHTTLVVDAPGMGDDIQAIKAGILEIADILVINKADRPGVEHTEKALRGMLELSHPISRTFKHHGQNMKEKMRNDQLNLQENGWIPCIQKTNALEGSGIPELAEKINDHEKYLESSGNRARRDRYRLEAEIDAIIQETLTNEFRANLPQKDYESTLQEVIDRKLSPWEAVTKLIDGRKV